ncbi:MAG: beta-galactosidase [Clostridia bacterium]|nr:beta-galactosidase [Clostridia bacterium]
MEFKKISERKLEWSKDCLYGRSRTVFVSEDAVEVADTYTVLAEFNDISSCYATLYVNGIGTQGYGYTECRTGRRRRAAFVVNCKDGLTSPVRVSAVGFPDLDKVDLFPGRREDLIEAAKADRARPHEVKPGFKLERDMQLISHCNTSGDINSRFEDNIEYLRELCPYIRSMGFNGIESYVKWNLVEYEQGKYDWSLYDNIIDLAAEYDLKWFPLIIGGSAYALPEWYREHTEGFVGFSCLEHGLENNVPTIFNDQQTPYVVNYLHELGRHYEGNENVFGIRLGPSGNYGESQYPATGNWGYKGQHEHMHVGWWAYGPDADRRFGEYLERKYGDVATLAAAWQEEIASFADVHTFLPATATVLRKRKDFVDWYMYEMTLWCDKWGVWVRDELKSHDIYQSAGGWGMCESGTDFTDQTRGMIPINGGIRATNEDESYELNFAITRMLSSAARFYGVKFGSEPAGHGTARSIVNRLYNNLINDSCHLFYYHGNFTSYDFTAEQFSKYGPLLEKRAKPVIDVAVAYPDTMSKLSDSAVRYLDASAFYNVVYPLRRRLDYDFCSERMMLDGALERYKVLIFPCLGHEGEYMEKDALEAVDRFVKNGGTVILPHIQSNVRQGIATVEGDYSIFNAWCRGEVGKGKVIRINTLRCPLENYIDGIVETLQGIEGMDQKTYAMLSAQNERGVYLSALENGYIAVYNDLERESELVMADGRRVTLEPLSITLI